jgi:hypothetical protein
MLPWTSAFSQENVGRDEVSVPREGEDKTEGDVGKAPRRGGVEQEF